MPSVRAFALAPLILGLGCGIATPPPAPRLPATVAPAPAPTSTAATTVPVPLAVVRQWAGIAPDPGGEPGPTERVVVVTPEAFREQWHARRGEEAVPDVDFRTEFVVERVARDSRLVGLSLEGPDNAGNVTMVLLTGAGKPPAGSLGYVFVVVRREGIRSVDGQALPAK